MGGVVRFFRGLSYPQKIRTLTWAAISFPLVFDEEETEMSKRKQHSPEPKAKLALEALKGEQKVAVAS